MQQPDRPTSVDLLAELDELAAMARAGIRKLAAGEAVNGVSTLQKIENRAKDAARHARDREAA